MAVEIDKVYQFTFKSGFETINGIYRVTHATAYGCLMEQNVDLFTYLFEPAGKTQVELDTALDELKNESFYKLKGMNNDRDIYIPVSYILSYPAPDVHAYAKVMLTVDLGIFADSDALSGIISKLNDILSVDYGITASPNLMKYDERWMSKGAYDLLEQSRVDNKGTIVNDYAERKRLQTELGAANARIVALEDIIRDYDAQP